MADTVTDPLEKAVLSGAIFAGPDPEGREPHRPASDDDLDSDNGDAAASGFPGAGDATGATSMPAGPVRTTKGQSHNTGVKGVLADYRNRNNDKTPSASSSKQMNKTSKAFKSLSTRNDKNGDAKSSDESGLSEGEDEARDAYRRKRMEEMRLMGSSERREDASRQKFGHLREVGQSQFIKAVEDRNAHCVIVHVYDSSIPSCIVMDAHLSSLARRYPYTKFLRARSRDLEFARGDEEDVLPTLLVYRQGEVSNNLVAFDRELSVAIGGDEDDEVDSSSISRDMVEKALVRHGVLQVHMAVQADSSEEEDDDE